MLGYSLLLQYSDFSRVFWWWPAHSSHGHTDCSPGTTDPPGSGGMRGAQWEEGVCLTPMHPPPGAHRNMKPPIGAGSAKWQAPRAPPVLRKNPLVRIPPPGRAGASPLLMLSPLFSGLVSRWHFVNSWTNSATSSPGSALGLKRSSTKATSSRRPSSEI